MRVLLDTNILISYLLTPESTGPIRSIIHAAYGQSFALLITQYLVDELLDTLKRKPYLAERITIEDADEFLKALLDIAELIPAIPPSEIRPATRDPKDDYLLAHALIGRADFLVTGDEDLLALGDIGDLKIVSPIAFAETLMRGSWS